MQKHPRSAWGTRVVDALLMHSLFNPTPDVAIGICKYFRRGPWTAVSDVMERWDVDVAYNNANIYVCGGRDDLPIVVEGRRSLTLSVFQWLFTLGMVDPHQLFGAMCALGTVADFAATGVADECFDIGTGIIDAVAWNSIDVVKYLWTTYPDHATWRNSDAWAVLFANFARADKRAPRDDAPARFTALVDFVTHTIGVELQPWSCIDKSWMAARGIHVA